MKYFEKVRISRGRRRLGAAQEQDDTQIALKAFGIRASAQGKLFMDRGQLGLDAPEDASVLMALQSKGIASTVTSQKNSVQLDGLQPDARYVVQVRARTVAGYGQYSRPAEFETTSERGTPLSHHMPVPAPTQLSDPFTHCSPLTTRLRCPATPRTASPDCGIHRSWVCLHGGRRGHRSCLPQVLWLPHKLTQAPHDWDRVLLPHFPCQRIPTPIHPVFRTVALLPGTSAPTQRLRSDSDHQPWVPTLGFSMGSRVP